MKIRLLLLFIFLPAFVFSQTKIRGKVIDKETQKPVSDVIIHSSGRISITNDKGEYDFEINRPETVYFRHLSYKSFNIQSNSLQDNGVVYLTSNVTELDEIVISPNRAKSLLKKAINNLFVNFQKEKTTTYYLTHIEETTTKGGDREVYALLETLLDKVDVKKEFGNLKLRLVQIDRTKKVGDNDFAVKGENITTDFFPAYLGFSSGKTKKDTTTFCVEIHDENNDYVIIKTYPQHPSKRYYYYSLFTINKHDTVLTEVIAQSYSDLNDLTTRNFKGFSYNISNQFDKYKFTKNTSGLYCLEQFQHLVHLKVMTDIPYEITLKAVVHAVENISPDEIESKNKKRIYSTFSYYLYKSKLPDTPGFWKKYVNH
jgi:hypothetical protein